MFFFFKHEYLTEASDPVRSRELQSFSPRGQKGQKNIISTPTYFREGGSLMILGSFDDLGPKSL